MSESGVPTAPLLERNGELGAINAAIDGAARGDGGTLLIDGVAGIGKTRLLAEVGRRSRETGATVLTASGSEIERDFGFGVVRQLFGALVEGLGPEQRGRLFAGSAALAAPIFGAGAELETGSGEAALYGLYWLVAALAVGGTPLVLVVDDAHWADGASLRFLHYLGRRLDGQPILIALGARPREPGAQAAILGGVVGDLDPERVQPRTLSAEATASMVRARLDGRSSAELEREIHGATGGNPLLVTEVISEVEARGGEDAAVSVSRMGPARIADGILRRAAEFGSDAPELVRAAAILGDGARTRSVAALAGLEADRAAELADGLAGVSILTTSSPVRFAHPLLRSSVYESIPAATRGETHGRAATLLIATGAEAEEAAAQLLLAEPGTVDGALGALATAAGDAARRGAADSAAAYLRRAIAEAMPEEDLAALLLQLGLAESALRDPAAIAHLWRAWELAERPELGIEASLRLADGLAMAGDWAGNVEATERGLERFGDSGLPSALHLEARLASIRAFDPDRIGDFVESLPRLEGLIADSDPFDSRHVRWVVGSLGSIRDSSNAAVLDVLTAGMGRVTFGDGDGWESPVVTQVAMSLLVIDAFDVARIVEGDLRERGRATGSSLAALAGTAYAAALSSRSGDLATAEADMRIATDMLRESEIGAVAVLALFFFSLDALIERPGLSDVADLILATDIPPAFASTATGGLVHDAKATILAVRGDRAASVEHLRAAAPLLGPLEVGPRTSTWRSRLALLLPPADGDEADELIARELELARAAGSDRAIGVTLRAAAERAEPARAIELLSESVACERLAGSPLELARSLATLGAAQRRGRQSTEARESLREALDLAQRCGAERLEERVFGELQVAGARPRRREVSGAGSLTPAELRVASAAAGGSTNREIAQHLFVSQRTIEMHLTNAYRKLGINSRSELAVALR